MLHFTDTLAELNCRIIDGDTKQTYQRDDIQQQVARYQLVLQQLNCERVVLLAESSVAWLWLDFACQASDTVFVPIPHYFSANQVAHVLEQVAPDLVLVDNALDHLLPESFKQSAEPLSQTLPWPWLSWQCSPLLLPELPKHCGKITFTSGSTGQPKGVCLSSWQQQVVAQSLVQRIDIEQPRHLCVLPLVTLLENVAGVYAPLLADGEVIVLSDSARGFQGSQLSQPQALLAAISQWQPTSLILVPELLQLLIHASLQGWQAPSSLRFIAVGGSKVAPALLQQAAQLGLPVFQGYGLSECCSVVALNTVAANTIGQHNPQQLNGVGQVLSHIELRLIDDEVQVRHPLFLGYLGDDADSALDHQGWYATGDLGHLDEQGHLTIFGRKKNLLINSFGRNIHPEWVESELKQNGLIQQAVVLGDGAPFCTALLFSTASDSQLEAWLQKVNHHLPDYAQVKRWQRLTQPLSVAQGTLTNNGRPKRAEISKQFQHVIDDMYLKDAI